MFYKMNSYYILKLVNFTWGPEKFSTRAPKPIHAALITATAKKQIKRHLLSVKSLLTVNRVL